MCSLEASTFPPDIKPTRTPLPSLPGFEHAPEAKPLIDLSAEDLCAFGHLTCLTEALILNHFSRSLASGTTHTGVGQELAAMAVPRALDAPEDAVLSNHRYHGHFLTYSDDFPGLVAETMVRETGVCGGRGGSPHLAAGYLHSNGVRGGMTGLGASLVLLRRETHVH